MICVTSLSGVKLSGSCPGTRIAFSAIRGFPRPRRPRSRLLLPLTAQSPSDPSPESLCLMPQHSSGLQINANFDAGNIEVMVTARRTSGIGVKADFLSVCLQIAAGLRAPAD